MTFLYHRFPLLRPLLDITYYFYIRLPTNAVVNSYTPPLLSKYESNKLMSTVEFDKNNKTNQNSSFCYMNTRQASSFNNLKATHNTTQVNTLSLFFITSKIFSLMHVYKNTKSF